VPEVPLCARRAWLADTRAVHPSVVLLVSFIPWYFSVQSVPSDDDATDDTDTTTEFFLPVLPPFFLLFLMLLAGVISVGQLILFIAWVFPRHQTILPSSSSFVISWRSGRDRRQLACYFIFFVFYVFVVSSYLRGGGWAKESSRQVHFTYKVVELGAVRSGVNGDTRSASCNHGGVDVIALRNNMMRYHDTSRCRYRHLSQNSPTSAFPLLTLYFYLC
jgi:hypothetical protein